MNIKVFLLDNENIQSHLLHPCKLCSLALILYQVESTSFNVDVFNLKENEKMAAYSIFFTEIYSEIINKMKLKYIME